MSEVDATENEKRGKRDRKRLRSVAIRHGAYVLAAFTLWGAADAWASATGWFLAETIALMNAVFAGTAIAYICHEWGHFAGARLSGAVSPVAKEPVSFFMFTFKDELNTRGQFISMSVGGPAANWTLVLLLYLMLPLDTWSQALFLATTFAIAISVSVFEFPVINRVLYGDNPAETIDNRLKETGNMPRNIGIVGGAVLWLITV
ncbi:MAG: hypothetical protein ISP91_04635 [Pseudomonadales bacterium]|jgi:hypothetical protein|nr:hypothetical protein [Pseudomonadales bacterium]